LIPGCGTGYEARALHTAGFDVLAIDFAEAALARAREALGAALADRLLHHADFFAFEAEPFDWIYERAFLAALPPALWPLWAARCADLLKPGGLLAGFFVIEAALPAVRRGPPFVTTAGELQALLDPGFTQIAATAVPPDESVSVFAGREQWQVWRRRG
jgi:SAM-dependent methyltransferase